MPHTMIQPEPDPDASRRRRWRVVIFYFGAVVSTLAMLAAGYAIVKWKEADDATRQARRAAVLKQLADAARRDRQDEAESRARDVAICRSQRELTRKIRDFVLVQLVAQRAQLPQLTYYREHPDELAGALDGLDAYEQQVRATFNPRTACSTRPSGPGRTRPDTGVPPGEVAP